MGHPQCKDFAQCFSSAASSISFIDLRIVLGSSTRPAETMALAKSCSVTRLASFGLLARNSFTFLMIGFDGLISN